MAAIRAARQDPSASVADAPLLSTAGLVALAARARAAGNAARSELERGRELHDVGLLPASALREQEARAAAAEREMAAVAALIELATAAEETRHQLDARRARAQSELQTTQAEAEQAAATEAVQTVQRRVEVGIAGRDELAEARGRLQVAASRLNAAGTEQQVVQEEAALRLRHLQMIIRLVGELQGASHPDGAPVTDPAAVIQAGDVLSIEVAGEPEVPRTYIVDPDGAIRLPLLGLVDVGGG